MDTYDVDDDNRHQRRQRRGIERMAAQAAQEDAIADSLNEPDEMLASAIAAGQEDHAAHVKLQLLQAEIDARRRDEADRVGQLLADGVDEQEIADSEEMPEQKRERKRR